MTKTMNRLYERATSDQGASMIVVVLLMLIATVVGTTSLRMALHANDSTVTDRRRVHAVQAAEAGISRALDRLELNSACDATTTPAETLYDGEQAVGTFQTRIDPEAGQLCTTAYRLVHAWGFAPTATGPVMRHLEVNVQLIPQAGFQFTLFASGSKGIVSPKNTGTITGDIYAETLDQSQNNLSADNVLSPGSIQTKDNAVYSGTLWAGGDVTLAQNASVGGSIIAAGTTSAGNVTLQNNTNVARDVQAAGTVALPTNYTISGSLSQNNPNLPSPPVLDRPTFTWSAANYSPAPQTFTSASLLETSMATSKNSMSGTYYLNSPGSTLKLPSSMTVSGNLTIVTTGKVELGTSIANSGGPWTVSIVSLNTAADAITTNQFTGATGLDILIFTTGGVDFKNQVTFKGAVYANEIVLKNNASISQSPTLAATPPVGFDFSQNAASQFTVVPTMWREVEPGSGP